MRQRNITTCAILTLLSASMVFAHITIWPKESAAGAR